MSVISAKLFDSLKHKQKVLQCNTAFGGAGGEALIPKGFSITGRHFLPINGEIVAQRITTPTMEPILKTKGKIKIKPTFYNHNFS